MLARDRFCELVAADVALVKSSIGGTSMFIMMHSDRFSGSESCYTMAVCAFVMLKDLW